MTRSQFVMLLAIAAVVCSPFLMGPRFDRAVDSVKAFVCRPFRRRVRLEQGSPFQGIDR